MSRSIAGEHTFDDVTGGARCVSIVWRDFAVVRFSASAGYPSSRSRCASGSCFSFFSVFVSI
jgi:hypothetical protein